MRKIIIVLITTLTFVSLVSGFLYAQEGKTAERILLLREAKEDGKTTAAVEAYLIGDILEVKVIARMYATKPSIYNVILVGPNIGRISPITRGVLPSGIEEEEPFPATERSAFIDFGAKTKTKKAEGTLTRELVRFKIPTEKIIPGKRYQLWVKVESMQSGGETHGFKFNLDNLAKIITP